MELCCELLVLGWFYFIGVVVVFRFIVCKCGFWGDVIGWRFGLSLGGVFDGVGIVIGKSEGFLMKCFFVYYGDYFFVRVFVVVMVELNIKDRWLCFN